MKILNIIFNLLFYPFQKVLKIFGDKLTKYGIKKKSLEPIARATIIFYPDEEKEIKIELIDKKTNKEEEKEEYILLALYYFAKIMLVVPSQFKGINILLNTIKKITDNKDFKKMILIEPSYMEMDLMSIDMGSYLKYSKREKKYMAISFYLKSMERHITTEIPSHDATANALFTILLLIQKIASLLETKNLKIFQDALKYMNDNYLNGYNRKIISNASKLPIEAIEYSLKINNDLKEN